MLRSRWLPLLAVGLLVRLACLPLWGTFDTEVQKAWSAQAARYGLADIYGPSDAELRAAAPEAGALELLLRPQPRTRFDWAGGSYFVDYPPGSVLLLWAVGRLYGLARPEFDNGGLFNAAINLMPLLASLAIAWLLARSAPAELGRRRALAYWLNPAMLLAAPVLGYQDPIFGALALAAVLTLMSGRHVAATALVVVAGLVKPQGALLLPVLAAVTLREAPPRRWAAAAAAGLATALLVLAPWWTSGYLLSALDGCGRPLTQTTLAPLGLNLWWVAGWAMDASHDGAGALARIVQIPEFAAWAGFDPRWPSRALLGLAVLASLAMLLRAPREDRLAIPLAVILQVHAYAFFGTSVHENHSFLAPMLAPLLLGAWERGRAVVSATSAFLFANLFLAAGLGRRVTRLADVNALRAATGVDASVLVALLHAVLLALLFVWVTRRRRAPAYTPSS